MKKKQPDLLNKPGTQQTPFPRVSPGQERPNENFRAEAVARTEIASPNANSHLRDEAGAGPQDQSPPDEKNRRNAAAPKRGFDRGDSRSQPDNYHPYASGEASAPATRRKT